MRINDMYRLGRRGNHELAPDAWHKVPNVTGDFDLDASIMHATNKDMKAKLAMHLVVGPAYGPRGYGGYHGYHGDD